MNDLVFIDPEFKSLIPPLTYTEREQLEANLLADGCLDSLKTWNGVLLDGHNRFEICTAHDLPYRTEKIHLDSRDDAVIWICKNQTGRRNITDEQRTYLLGKQYAAEKKITVRDQTGKFTPRDQSEPTALRTSERVAAEMGVGHMSVKRAEKYAQGIDIIGQTDPALKGDILAGKKSVVKKDVSNIIQLPVPERRAAIDKIKRGERTTQPKASFTAEQLFPETTSQRTVDDVIREIVNASKDFLKTLDAIIDRNRDLVDTDTQKISDAIIDAANKITERTEMFK